LAWAARAAGHEVAVAGREPVAEAARRAGLCAFEVAEAGPEAAPASPNRGEVRAEPAFAGMAALLRRRGDGAVPGRSW
ncbi:hypothetical protein G3I76_38870, partial [Streptomyces sp. SID11233]|nr:hypothetical protein [Streptomyces sp. SID11233]